MWLIDVDTVLSILWHTVWTHRAGLVHADQLLHGGFQAMVRRHRRSGLSFAEGRPEAALPCSSGRVQHSSADLARDSAQCVAPRV
eukprot:COSAG01_NODE_573_length_15298_cov_13.922394_9_plen_85_part_00